MRKNKIDILPSMEVECLNLKIKIKKKQLGLFLYLTNLNGMMVRKSEWCSRYFVYNSSSHLLLSMDTNAFIHTIIQVWIPFIN